jgi:replicative DNA helicase Mcm
MNDVGTKNFIDELLKTSKFTEDEARAYMKKAMQNGQIFERKAGWLSKSL